MFTQSHLATRSRDFLFLLASARKSGSTEALARQAAAGLPPQDTQHWLRLADLPLPPCNDTRNNRDHGYRAPIGHENTLLQATLRASDLVIASPLYWYSLSASAKLYLDHWSGWLRLPGIDFAACMRGKTLWTVSALSGTDPAAAQPMVDMLRMTADYLGMHWGDALLATGCHGSARALSGPARAREFFTSRSVGLSH
jgi:NAD(P)H-dependent FMN reductase